uniref:LuxR family transcriptional regulator n=1 Tax=uncultured bacterium 14 TaxID=1748267 RepID=A0A0U3BBL1_9BACT|nr:LuxR family transcriptional regulator [uncultured bacterium 14]
MVTGLTYCSVIDGCQQAHAMRRAHEWTAALAQWCQAQPEMVAFSGICLVHRAEIQQMHGAWAEALDEARRAMARCEAAGNRQAVGAAWYQQAEVLRLRGAFDDAEDAYGQASRHGRDPQPGLALLRAAQGRVREAARAIDVALRTTAQGWRRARLLPAAVEILLQGNDIDAACNACNELEAIASGFGSEELMAAAACARGSIALASGQAHEALQSLQRAAQLWQQHDAPYLLARARALAAQARHALGDVDGSRLELDAARALFTQLGAMPDLARADVAPARSGRPHGLTVRELQVLRLVAAGKSNKVIAAELFLSERTIDRHVSNILAKLDVPSRAAATACAYEFDLMRRA